MCIRDSSKTQQKSVQKNGTSRPVKNERKTTKATGNSKGQSQRRGKQNNVPLKIACLGGLNEVGKNMTLYECGNDMMLVDLSLIHIDRVFCNTVMCSGNRL